MVCAESQSSLYVQFVFLYYVLVLACDVETLSMAYGLCWEPALTQCSIALNYLTGNHGSIYIFDFTLPPGGGGGGGNEKEIF
jgi:hypothetical protein